MIKVNLLRNLGLGEGAIGGVQVIAVDQQKQGIFKAIAILIFPILIYGYETMTISDLTRQRDALNTEIAQIEEKKTAYGDAGPKVEKFTKEKKKIDEQVEVIRGIARNRLREVKTFDSLQTMTPSQVWFDGIEIEGNMVKASGYSNTEDGVATLYASLNNSPLFSRFEPKGQTQEMVGGIRVMKFNIEFRIGRE